MIPQIKKLKNRQGLIDLFSDKLSGIPRIKNRGSLPDAEMRLLAFIPGLKPGDFCEGIKLGIPRHRGRCKKFSACSKSDPEKMCAWLKASRIILARFKTPVFIFLFFLWMVVCGLPAHCYAAAPAVGTVIPASGTGQTGALRVFTTTYTDTDGWQNIQYVYFLIDTSTSGTNCPYFYYNQNTNKLYVRNDANSAWLGGYVRGTAIVIENSYAKLDCAQTTVTGSGTTMTVNWAVTIKPPFTGAKNTYLYVRDDTNAYVNLTKKGTWTIPNTAPQPPTVIPSFGASVPNTAFNIKVTYSDPDTWLNLQNVYLLVNTSTTPKDCLYVYYSQNNNRLYLRNDSNTAWLGGFAPGAANVIENTYVKLNYSTVAISGSGNNLVVTWSVTFKNTFLGAKNTYLSATDDASASFSLTQKGSWAALDNGTVIGTSGGEVYSSDGKVKLIVPAGALSAATALYIATVPNETLQGAVPQGTAMLSAVDCKPYGIVFAQPVSLTYTLSQADIPGTPVELGLYDSVQQKIIPTGQASVIAADGLSVKYAVSHFSTYAALKNLVPQGAPIGGGVKIPLPDMFTGVFGHSILLSVSPGRKGVQPALGLSYRSGNPNSWVGQGVSLNPGYIVRSTRLGPPAYDDIKDTFYFITDAGTTELVHLINNLYQAKIESFFVRFYKESDDSWRVVSKDGSVLRFGQISDAREGSGQATFSWYLTKAVDTNGNYVEYSYLKDQGKCYLSRIDYAGSDTGVSPTNSVEFILEPREDIFSSYISTSKIVTAKRLKEVITKVNNSMVWRYVLEYTYSADTHRSLLTSLTQYAADGKNLPVQKFVYQKSHD